MPGPGFLLFLVIRSNGSATYISLPIGFDGFFGVLGLGVGPLDEFLVVAGARDFLNEKPTFDCFSISSKILVLCLGLFLEATPAVLPPM